MTNEEASYLLANADRTNFDEFMNKALDMAIKALEHEPRFILKSDGTIEQIKNYDVLDKIRAEIQTLEDGISSYHNDRPWIYKDEVLDIIDKYRAESEDEE